ncbi:MAG: glycoside hydrolase family 3 protein [Acetatifactor sp.]
MEENRREEQNQQERREARRKRRIRNQIISYIVVTVLLIAAGTGVVYGVKNIMAEKQAQEAARQSEQAVLDSLVNNEGEISVPEPSSSTEPVVELTPEQKLDEIINEAVIGVMPLEDKVAGLFIVTPEAITNVSAAVMAGEGTQKALSQYAVGGLIYFEKNIVSPEQFREMMSNTQLYTRYPLFLAVDEEGGRVARLSDNGIGTKVDAASVIGQQGVDNAYQSGVILGSNLSGAGLNLDLAPVADLKIGEESYMGDRSFGSDPQVVGPVTAAVVQGIQSQGVSACLKHFPGMGSTTRDPHKEIAGTDRTEAQFRAEEFPVFQAGIDSGVKMVMISNIAAPALSGNDLPCVFSEEVIGILRNEMGFEGVIISDAMNMSAVSDYYDSAEASIMAIKAGCDMILMPEDFEKAYNGVLEAVKNGTISEERINDSLRRIYRIKYANKIGQ